MGKGPGLGGGLEVILGVMTHRVVVAGGVGLPLLWLREEEVSCAVPREEKGDLGHQEVTPLCWFDGSALCSLE